MSGAQHWPPPIVREVTEEAPEYSGAGALPDPHGGVLSPGSPLTPFSKLLYPLPGHGSLRVRNEITLDFVLRSRLIVASTNLSYILVHVVYQAIPEAITIGAVELKLRNIGK